jgi:hypothetical protein
MHYDYNLNNRYCLKQHGGSYQFMEGLQTIEGDGEEEAIEIDQLKRAYILSLPKAKNY